MSKESLNQAYNADPTTELPLEGFYGGKPIRFLIDYDDQSSTSIGNAYGSVDLIVANLRERRAEKPTGAQETGAARTDTLIEKLRTAGKFGYSANMIPTEMAVEIIRQHEAEQPQDMVERVLTVTPEGSVFWRHADGSHRCLTASDARLINTAITAYREPGHE